MALFDISKIIITDVAEVFTCTHIAGNIHNMYDRKNYGVTLAINGSITYCHSSGNFISDQQHAVFLPRGKTYSFRCLDTGRFTILNFDALNAPDSFACIPISNLSELLKIQCSIEYKRISEPFERLSAISEIYSMLARLTEVSGEYSLPSPLKRAIEYAAQNLRNPSLTVKELAAAAGISEIYLRKLFNSCQNTSPSRYIRSLRMRHAMNLLTAGDSPIRNVAEECGYVDICNFSKAFKQETGCTPSEYRRISKIKIGL